MSQFISAGMIGADPDQLASLGSTLSHQREATEAMISLVTAALANTTWSGPARQAFEADWQASFRIALTRIGEAFELAGRDCLVRSTELRRVMGGF